MRTITDYMMSLHKQLQAERTISDTTASAYIRSLYMLNADRPFTNLAWLKNVESVNVRIANYAESTQKTLLSTIVSTLSLVKTKPTYKKIYTYWYNAMMEKVKDDRDRDTSKKTDKQEENWLSWDVVKSHEERLKNESNELLGKKEFSVLEWETLLSYMVLSLYTLFAPRRNQDYQYMKVVPEAKYATDENTNYLILKDKKFVFRKYKTAKTHGEQAFDIPADLWAVVEAYIKVHPLMRGKKKGPIPFLVTRDGTPLTAVNAMTRILNRIFGKRVGATMLRHIYLSSKYDVDEMNKDAEKMGHDASMQREYMKKEEAQTVDLPTTPE